MGIHAVGLKAITDDDECDDEGVPPLQIPGYPESIPVQDV